MTDQGNQALLKLAWFLGPAHTQEKGHFVQTWKKCGLLCYIRTTMTSTIATYHRRSVTDFSSVQFSLVNL